MNDSIPFTRTHAPRCVLTLDTARFGQKIAHERQGWVFVLSLPAPVVRDRLVESSVAWRRYTSAPPNHMIAVLPAVARDHGTLGHRSLTAMVIIIPHSNRAFGPVNVEPSSPLQKSVRCLLKSYRTREHSLLLLGDLTLLFHTTQTAESQAAILKRSFANHPCSITEFSQTCRTSRVCESVP